MYHLINYKDDKTTFKQIDKAFCQGFIDYLKTATNANKGVESKPLNVNTQLTYMRMFETVLYTAMIDEVITVNPFKQIKPENKPKAQKSEINYLTIEEVRALENTECFNDKIKQAFLFSCYTGLRFSDIKSLTWGKLQFEFLPDKATAKNTDAVFDLPSGSYINIQLKQWAFLAKVPKNLSFHVARHTYATILLSLGAGIETISKNLGHSEIKTTQAHYAAIENKLQRAAVNLFDKLD